MILCLTCFSLSPRDALFCEHCGAGLSAKYCGNGQKRHKNHPTARVCAYCGSDKLSTYTPCLRLGCLTWLLAGVGGWLLIKWLWPYVLVAAKWSLNILLNYVPEVIEFVTHWMVVLLVIYLCLYLIPGEVGKQLRGAFIGFLKFSLRLAIRTISGVLKALFRPTKGDKKTTKT